MRRLADLERLQSRPGELSRFVESLKLAGPLQEQMQRLESTNERLASM